MAIVLRVGDNRYKGALAWLSLDAAIKLVLVLASLPAYHILRVLVSGFKRDMLFR